MALVILQIIEILLKVAWWIVILHAIFSWLVAFNVVNTSNDLVRNLLFALDRMTEPLYRPIRKVMPDLGALDLAPMVVLLILMIIQGPILGALYRNLV